jgi:hypothetical protein
MINRIKRLYGKMLGPISQDALRNIFACATAFAVAVSCIPEAQGPGTTTTPPADNPAFSSPVVNPFGLTNVGYPTRPVFADIDGDGDQDLFACIVQGEQNKSCFSGMISVETHLFLLLPRIHLFNCLPMQLEHTDLQYPLPILIKMVILISYAVQNMVTSTTMIIPAMLIHRDSPNSQICRTSHHQPTTRYIRHLWILIMMVISTCTWVLITIITALFKPLIIHQIPVRVLQRSIRIYQYS